MKEYWKSRWWAASTLSLLSLLHLKVSLLFAFSNYQGVTVGFHNPSSTSSSFRCNVTELGRGIFCLSGILQELIITYKCTLCRFDLTAALHSAVGHHWWFNDPESTLLSGGGCVFHTLGEASLKWPSCHKMDYDSLIYYYLHPALTQYLTASTWCPNDGQAAHSQSTQSSFSTLLSKLIYQL